MKTPIKSNFNFRESLRRALGIAALWGLILFFQGCGIHYVSQVPLATIEVRPEIPYPNAIWIDGGWYWSGGRHIQRPGYYTHSRPGRTYHSGEWKQSPRGTYYVRGRWQK